MTFSYKEFFDWALEIGNKLKEKDEKLIKDLIYEIRGEESPGRFLDKLSRKLAEYKTNRNLNIDVSLNQNIMMKKWHGDSFYYLKAAILSGLLNSMATEEKSKKEQEQNE